RVEAADEVAAVEGIAVVERVRKLDRRVDPLVEDPHVGPSRRQLDLLAAVDVDGGVESDAARPADGEAEVLVAKDVAVAARELGDVLPLLGRQPRQLDREADEVARVPTPVRVVRVDRNLPGLGVERSVFDADMGAAGADDVNAVAPWSEPVPDPCGRAERGE